MTAETQNRIEQLSALGFRLECGPPSGQVDNSGEKAWPHIAYTVTLFHDSKKLLVTDYKLGIGHVEIRAVKFNFGTCGLLTTDEDSMARAWQRNPHASFKDKQLQAEVAAKLARQQNVSPNLADVLHSLLLDGEAFFNGETFEEWASNFGYDTDSRKAEEIFKACDLIGRQLNKVPCGVLNKAREITQDM